MRGNHGITIVELLVASFVLGLLGLLTVALFRTGASSWKKLEAQSSMLAEYEVLNEKLSREIQRSVYASASTAVSPDGSTLAFLSAIDEHGVFVLNPTTHEPEWQKYLIFYFHQPTRKCYMAELPLAAGSPEKDTPETLENYDAGSGNLNDYRKDGRLLMTDLDVCNFTLADSMLNLEIGGSRSRYGSSQPEVLKMTNSTAFRN